MTELEKTLEEAKKLVAENNEKISQRNIRMGQLKLQMNDVLNELQIATFGTFFSNEDIKSYSINMMKDATERYNNIMKQYDQEIIGAEHDREITEALNKKLKRLMGEDNKITKSEAVEYAEKTGFVGFEEVAV